MKMYTSLFWMLCPTLSPQPGGILLRTLFLVYKQWLLLCPHIVEVAKELSGDPFIRALILLMKALPSRPNYLPKAPPPNTISLSIQILTWILGRHKHSDHSLILNCLRWILCWVFSTPYKIIIIQGQDETSGVMNMPMA